MKFNSIRFKIIIYSTLCILVSGAAIIIFATISVRNTAINNAYDLIGFAAKDHANHVKIELNRAITSIKTLSIILNKIKNSLNPINLEREEIDFLLQSILKTNKHIIGAYTCWPPNGFDNKDKMYINEPGHDETGRFAPYWYRNTNGILEVEPLKHEKAGEALEFQHIHKDIGQLFISDPHIKKIGDKDYSVISLVMPINSKKKFQGYSGIDFCCSMLQSLVQKPDIEKKEGQILITNSNLKILAITGRPDLACKNIAQIPTHLKIDIKKMADLKPFEISLQDKIEFFAPVIFINSKPLWVIVSLSKGQITLEAAILSKKLIVTGISCIIVSIFFLWFFSAHIVRSLDLLIKGTKLIGQGNYNIPIQEINSGDEIGELASTLNIMSNEIAKKDLEKDKIIKDLHKAEKKYRVMMESMNDPVVISTKDYIIEYMNPKMIQRIGYDATGEKCFKALHGLNEKCSWCMADKIQQDVSFTTEIVSPKDKRSFHVSHSPVVNKNGNLSKLTVFRDTTDFKKLELQLVQAQKMETIGTLAGGIAHDFNNILFPIIGYTEMLLEDAPEDGPLRNSLNEIYTSSLRAKDLVNQILTFSRQGTNELKLMKMQPIIKEVLKLIRATTPTTISINENLQSDCGAIKADPTQIHQIVMNLTTNAYHAMEENGGELSVTLKEIKLDQQGLITPDMTPGSYACLEIADTGRGMDKNLIDKIFDPFFTTKEKGKGTGMGLSVVHGIVKSMGGAIQVHSEPGNGTKFHIFLPIVKISFVKQELQAGEPIIGGTESVFLVDDEKSIIAMEKQALERLGYDVTSSTSSIEALELFRATPDKYDVVITDMAMPKMPGDKLAVELIKIRPDIPILLCTGFSQSMSEEKIKSLGVKGLLLKPIIMKDLARKMREVLDIT